MPRSSSTSSSKIPVSLAAFAAMVVAFILVNVGLAVTARYWDSNAFLMDDLNDREWIEGADVLFLGDSRSHQGMVPTVFEATLADEGLPVTAMNLARPGQQTPFFYYIAKRVAAEAEHKPKAVVLNISFYLLGGNSWLKDVYFSYYRPSVEEAQDVCKMGLLNCGQALEWFVRTRFPAWAHRARVNSFINAFLRDPIKMSRQIATLQQQNRDAEFSLSKGYLTRGYEHITSADVKPGIYKTGVEKGFDVYFDYLTMFINEMDAQGIEVFVYEFPWPIERQNEPGFQEILTYYKDLLIEKTAGRVHFLPTVRYWPDELFVDAQHVNQPGAERLTHDLAEELAATPEFARLFNQSAAPL
jgi:hypothetical protein